MPKKIVHVIGPTFGLDDVFPEYGYGVVLCRDNPDPAKVDIACWTGGADISPELYGQKIAGTVGVNHARDKREVELWKVYKDKPKLGVCRGAQLLNVLNGGSMYQHVDRHGGSPHYIETVNGEQVLVCSVHHQLMIPAPESVLVAWTKLSTIRVDDKGQRRRNDDEVDPEVIYIPKDNALCFQAHPEFGPQSCTDYFFRLVNEYIKV